MTSTLHNVWFCRDYFCLGLGNSCRCLWTHNRVY